MSDLADVQAAIRRFRDDRKWMQFHNPKNLACSVAIEAAELLELFQWKTADESEKVAVSDRAALAGEIADVAIYLIELADNLNIDLFQAIHEKLSVNEQRYPIAKSTASAAKYTALQ